MSNKESHREKISFIVFGLLNFTITNLGLIAMLLFIPVALATGISVATNFLIGFYFNKDKVFARRPWLRQSQKIYFYRYGLVAIGSWLIYVTFIPLISQLLQANNSTSAIILIPILTIYSFLLQSHFVFKD